MTIQPAAASCGTSLKIGATLTPSMPLTLAMRVLRPPIRSIRWHSPPRHRLRLLPAMTATGAPAARAASSAAAAASLSRDAGGGQVPQPHRTGQRPGRRRFGRDRLDQEMRWPSPESGAWPRSAGGDG